MLFAAKLSLSLRALVIVMVGAPIIPALLFAILAPSRLIQGWAELPALGEVAVIGAGLRIMGGCAALVAAGWLIHSMRALSRAAGVLNDGGAPAKRRTGIMEIDAALSLDGGRGQIVARAVAAARSGGGGVA